jgi:mono/diheme cytochrome c family protein
MRYFTIYIGDKLISFKSPSMCLILATLVSCQVNSIEQSTMPESTEVSLERGEKIYGRYCLQCHHRSGEGIPGLYPPLAGSEWVGMESSVPIRIVLHGLQGEVIVKGQKYNNVMAPWGSRLSDSETASVLNYIRSSWGNSFSEVTSNEVSMVRSKYPQQKSWKSSQLR